MATGSVLAGIRPQQQPDLAGALLGGIQGRQNVLAGQQQLQQGQMELDRAPKVAAQQDALTSQEQQINEQAISDNEFNMAVQKARVINRLGKQMKPMSLTEREQFKQSLNPELLESLQINPQEVAQFGVDDQSIDSLIAQTDAALASVDGQDMTAGQRNRQELLEMVEGGIDPETGRLKPTDQLTAAQRAAANELGLTTDAGTATARERIASDEDQTRRVAESERVIEREGRAGQEVGKTLEERRANRIAVGTDAAKAVPTLRRTISLLERVETGGPEAVSLAVKQRLGLETADEGELSNKLGKAVLSQLRETFGAQFTQEEGERLERIEANYGKSTETNKRLLRELFQLSERKARQAIEDAVAIEDFETAAAIRDQMNFEFQEDAEILGPAAQSGNQRIRFDAQGNMIE